MRLPGLRDREQKQHHADDRLCPASAAAAAKSTEGTSTPRRGGLEDPHPDTPPQEQPRILRESKHLERKMSTANGLARMSGEKPVRHLWRSAAHGTHEAQQHPES
ncbi:hypothetical protein ABL78_7562 [Leptomonas seymouri]|uniref:Uncharacterized protein n=1 Tax=Leptomonas seymouri TaxID=5684 RepID=A0A0N1IH07_LEPSE|nr:hypothetical protein ABL78_7562 [Leptomonas seymouri]|eukprot:KPI83395.1 hypothetical protein ABL78_7562 [Leptomonas seymouri]